MLLFQPPQLTVPPKPDHPGKPDKPDKPGKKTVSEDSMTSDELIDEIARLDAQIAAMKQDIIMADGARQAFKYMLDKLVGPAPAEPSPQSPLYHGNNDVFPQTELPKGEDFYD
jgi:hypothetical protein